jgi:phage gpG-like protein
MIAIKCRFNGKALADVDRAVMGFSEAIDDMTPLWERLVAPISKSIGGNFKAQGNFKGPWDKLHDDTIAWKKKQGLSTRILEATGRLRGSIQRGAPDNICIIEKKRFTFGTSVPYGIYHDSDRPRTRLPWREFMILDPKTVNEAVTRSIAAFVKASGLPTGVLRKGSI